jgi:hypothetical protein
MAARDFLTELLYGFSGTPLPQEYRMAKSLGMELDDYKALQRQIQLLGQKQQETDIQSRQLSNEQAQQEIDARNAAIYAKSGARPGEVKAQPYRGLPVGTEIPDTPQPIPTQTGPEIAAKYELGREEEEEARTRLIEDFEREMKLKTYGFNVKREERLQKQFDRDIAVDEKADRWREEDRLAKKQRDLEEVDEYIWELASEETTAKIKAGAFNRPDLAANLPGGELYRTSPADHTIERALEMRRTYDQVVKGVPPSAPSENKLYKSEPSTLEIPNVSRPEELESAPEGPDPFAPPPAEEDYYTVPPGSPIVPNKELKGEAYFEDLKNQIEQSGARNAEDVQRMLGPFLTQKLVEYRQAMQ